MSRTRWTWVVVGGIATLLVVAGVDALLSSESGTSAPTTTDIKTSPSVEQEIERTGNRWARFFAANRLGCNDMSQPDCQRIACERQRGRAADTELYAALARVSEVVCRGGGGEDRDQGTPSGCQVLEWRDGPALGNRYQRVLADPQGWRERRAQVLRE